MTAKETKEARFVPFLGPAGQPFHKLGEAQKRGYTRGWLTESDSDDLSHHCEAISIRISEHQATRIDIRKQCRVLMTFPQTATTEERTERTDKVSMLSQRYVDLEEAIVSLKDTVFEIFKDEELALPPIP
tara:strand:+ start:4953 stop:5342 length:390 start_codon:yes stop_codon:yes gene_type:complete